MSSLPRLEFSSLAASPVRASPTSRRQTVDQWLAAGNAITRGLAAPLITFGRFVQILAAVPGVYDVTEPDECATRRRPRVREAYHYTQRSRDR